MVLAERNWESDSPLGEWSDTAQLAAALQELVEDGLTAEAMVRLQRLRIADQADALTQTSPDSQTALLEALPAQIIGEIIKELVPEDAAALCEMVSNDKLPAVLDASSPDITADVLKCLAPEAADAALAAMETAPEVAPLLEYEDDAAGGLMTPEFIALRETMNVAQALDFVRLWADEIGPSSEYMHYLFVVDRNGVLKGG